ncbi:hypothetical protein BLOT_002068 [Blomia tropicalis]|nr:hypothetical protein BLOT_002068 [Blomia tropicalis]
MKQLFITSWTVWFVFSYISVVSTRESKQSTIWPYPQLVVQNDEQMVIESTNFQILYSEASIPDCDLLLNAINRYTQRFFIQDCSRLDPNMEGQLFSSKPSSSSQSIVGKLQNVTVRYDGQCEEWPHLNMMENYTIVVDPIVGAIIYGRSIWGAIRGLETFSQLITYSNQNEFLINTIKIKDFPRFKHRGLLIDSSRHFLPIKTIFKTLDSMEMNKLNVLHWHIVDDESFPFESETFPELSRKGSYDPQYHVYRDEDVNAILEYARQRAIRVVVEFDSPGHTWSWGLGQPGLLTPCYGPNGQPNGIFGPIDPTKPNNFKFIRNLFTEIASRFKDQYIHLGGDEVSFDCWATNPSIREFMEQHQYGNDYTRLESYYVQKLVNIVKQLNRSYVVWQEVFDHNVTLKSDTVVHVWIGNDTSSTWSTELSKVTEAGYQALLSSPWYLDLISYGPDWRKYYESEPYSFDGTDEQKRLILGGEAAVWAEYINGANMISRTFPRVNAVAERLWSSQRLAKANRAVGRFRTQACRMIKLGIRIQPIDGPGWCECDYALTD